MHANMFLARHANDIMERDVPVLPADSGFDAFLRRHNGALKHVVVTPESHRRRYSRQHRLPQGTEMAYTGVSDATGEGGQQKNFIISHDDEIAFDVIDRMWREGAAMAVVVRQTPAPRAEDVHGIISKEHVADLVAQSIKPYA